MSMLKTVPTDGHLSRIYYELARFGANSAGARVPWPYKIYEREDLIALACDMSRFDPRLVDILVDFFANHWHEICPTKLRGAYDRMQSPQTVAVICEFLKEKIGSDEVKYFAEYLMAGLKPADPQFYFHNLYLPGGRLAQRAAEEGVYEYKKWGYLAAEYPVAGTFDFASRKNILIRLIRVHKTISIGDYLKEVGQTISRQQALLDIKKCGLIKLEGRGRGARWRLAA